MRAKVRSSLTAALLMALPSSQAAAQGQQSAINIGVLTDMSGALASASGPGSVIAATMAIEDNGGKVLGRPIILKTADHQNKPDIGLSTARRWIDVENVVALFDLANSGVAFAVQGVGRERNVLTVVTTAGATDLTGKACSGTGFHWVYNNFASANALAASVAGLKKNKWFFVTSDYAFGHSLEAEVTAVVAQAGGQVVGGVRVPLNTADMSSFLLQAQSSNADVVVLATAGADTVTALKQAEEFGMPSKQIFIVPVMFSDAVKAVGLKIGQGLRYASAYDWNLNDRTKAWAKRFFEKHRAMPTQSHVGVYSSVRHFLRAVEAAQTTEGRVVATKMRDMPVNDEFTATGKLRADGLLTHDMFVMEIKKPAESQNEWDLYKVVETIPARIAYAPLNASACPNAGK